MLRKLMKYELRSYFQTLLPLYIALLAAALLSNLFSNRMLALVMQGTPANLIGIIYFGLMVAVCTISMLMIIVRIYTGLLSEEGYLMLTLPVKPWQHIASKLICSVIVLVLGGIVAIISFVVLIFSLDFMDPVILRRCWKLIVDVSRDFSIHWIFYFVELIVLLFIAIGKQVLKAYAAISVGHLFSRHRIILSFLSYVVMGGIILWLWGLIGNLIDLLHLDHLILLLDPETKPQVWAYHLAFLLLIFWQGVEFILYYLVTHRILSKHLNLE